MELKDFFHQKQGITALVEDLFLLDPVIVNIPQEYPLENLVISVLLKDHFHQNLVIIQTVEDHHLLEPVIMNQVEDYCLQNLKTM